VTRALLALLVGAALAGCSLAGPATPTPVRPGVTPTPTPTEVASSTPAPTPSPTASATLAPTATPTQPAALSFSPNPTLAAGSPTPGCVNGWQGLDPADPLYIEGVDILANYMGLTDPLNVVDLRYFTGPDVPWILEPHFDVVERWYVKAVLSTDPGYRGRWLIEKRTVDRLGVSAVAPFDTTGYSSPDWHGFEGEGLPRVVAGLPGLWSGIDYDFVTGAGDSGFPGLPDQVVDCLTGT
jgi:hypothetical protein